MARQHIGEVQRRNRLRAIRAVRDRLVGVWRPHRAGRPWGDGQYPWLAQAFLFVVSFVVAMGGLISFWILAPDVEFRVSGHQVKWQTANRWVYEERQADGSIECLPFSREVIGDGYPPPCEVYILSEDRWDQETPLWAQGRRTEILARIGNGLGADARGGRVEFKDTA